jgi:sugar lactone lactonase YvrE
VNGLSPATVYSWQVRAISSGGTTLADYGWWRFNTSPSYLVSTLAGLPGVSGAADGTGGNARFVNPTGVALDSAGTLYVTERHRVRKITPLGVVTTLAGASTSGNTDASGTAARFNSPWDVAVDNAGVVYVADSSNHTIRKITPAGVVTTLAGLAGVSGTTDATGTAARFNNPRGIVVDGAGTVYVADFSNHTIRKITAAGEVTTLAGLAANPGTANGSGSTARFNFPQGMGIDNAGFLYVADVGSGRIRKISPAGDVTTLGINFAPGDIAVDSAGMVYVADTNFHMIWQITPAGVLTTIAGLSGTQGSTDGPEHLAKFGGPTGIAVDSNTGTLYIADRNNHTVRRRGPVINGPNLVNNGDFSAGTTSWQSFALPDSSYMSSAVVNGVFEFTKSAPPPGGASQATIFQNTGQSLPARASLQAQFALGNNSSVRKRISVLVLDSDFSDLSVCTFWLPANLPLTTYGIRTYTTKAWTNASIYFYAATDGANGGAYQVDNVGLWVQTGGPVQATTCIDPLTPAASLDAPGPTMLVNGDFGSGALSPWGVFGTITYQIGSGVFEFIRPNNTLPAGVVFQATNQAVAANQVLTSTFQLGNSSLVRKRVTVILHDSDFSDLSACTFWLAPQQQMSTYEVRTYATKPWANAMISFYPATTDTQQWIRLDAATLKRTPGMTNTGTRCIEPGGS